jgi:hypothetical protein
MRWPVRTSRAVVACLALVAFALSGTSCGGNDGASASAAGDRAESPAEPQEKQQPAASDADATGDDAAGDDAAGDEAAGDEAAGAGKSGGSGDCSFVDAGMVDEAFDEPFVAQVDPSPLLPAEGAVTCGFDARDGGSTATVVRLADAPHHFESYADVIKKNKSTAPFAEELSGIGDRALGGVVEDIAAQIAFEVGGDFMLVVGVSSARDPKLLAECKALATKLAG